MSTVHDPLPDRAPQHVLDYLEHTILRVEVGSTVYGTGRPGHEDHDQMGVFILPPWRVLGIGNDDDKVWRTAPEGQRSTPSDIDLSLYSARKYVRLAAKGNPSILVALFTPPDKTFTETAAGSLLRGSAGLFHTQEAGHRFRGYMDAQFRRMAGSRAGVRAPRSNRPELVAEFGYDTKFAMHAVRLGLQGLEFLETGSMQLPIPPGSGGVLRDIRAGRWTYEEVEEYGRVLLADLDTAIAASRLPVHADRDAVDRLLCSMHALQWDDKDWWS